MHVEVNVLFQGLVRAACFQSPAGHWLKPDKSTAHFQTQHRLQPWNWHLDSSIQVLETSPSAYSRGVGCVLPCLQLLDVLRSTRVLL